MRIVNPVAKAVAHSRRRAATRVVPPKKGKGSYNRNKDKKDAERKKDDE